VLYELLPRRLSSAEEHEHGAILMHHVSNIVEDERAVPHDPGRASEQPVGALLEVEQEPLAR
jgi:hypothetical protein